MIEVRGISLSYGGHERELDEVSFFVAGGEFASLVGPSGCGKSSLLRIIAGVLAPLAGEVLLDGRPVAEHPVKTGFVPQDGLLLPWRTVLANAALPLEIAGAPPAEREERARRLLALVGMEGAADRYPAGLSGGERQRVAIARALADEPAILLLDEPFASLDAITREELNLVLQEVWMRTGAAVLLVTHSISEAVFLADRVLVMGERPGRLLGELRVDLARPRTLQDLGRAEFAALTARVRAMLGAGNPGRDGRENGRSGDCRPVFPYRGMNAG